MGNHESVIASVMLPHLGRVLKINARLPRQEQQHAARVEEGTEGGIACLQEKQPSIVMPWQR